MANEGMGNRFLKRRGVGGRAQERQSTWRDARQTFCELYIIWRGRVKARDRSGDMDGEKESGSDLGKQSGFCGE